MKKLPQLPPPSKKVARDAAQAVKRVDSLGLPGMRVTQFAVEEENKEQYLHLFIDQRSTEEDEKDAI